MANLINRQDAIEAICEEIMSRFDVGVTEGYELVEDALSGLPSVEPRKKGKWKIRSLNICHTEWERYECSVCGWEAHMYKDDVGMNFCPHCGSYNGGKQE